jgi:hypothetical protein
MLDFLTEEQRQLRDAATEFARVALSHDVVARDRESRFERSLWQKCADFG